MIIKGLGILYFLFLTTTFLVAQCPVSVTITADKTFPVCRGTNVTFTATPTNGGVTPQYYWFVNGDTVSNGASSTFSTSQDFAYVNVVLESSEACTPDTARSSTIQIVNTTMYVEYNTIIEECNQPKADVEITKIGGIGTDPITYYYSDQGQKDVYEDLTSWSSYPIVLSDASSPVCYDTTYVGVYPKECEPIVPMPVITPNGDGANDYWRILHIEDYPENKVYIFDRWGQRVFFKENYTNNEDEMWQAKYLGGDMPISAYFYIIELFFEHQDTKVVKGPVSVAR